MKTHREIRINSDTLLEHSGRLYLNLKIENLTDFPLEVKVNTIAPFGWQLRNAAIGFFEKVNKIKEYKLKFMPLFTALPVMGEIFLDILVIDSNGNEKVYSKNIDIGTGYATRWKILGSLCNKNDEGLDIVSPVEKDIDKCFYSVDGKDYYWCRFLQDEFNCFGYVDFRVNGFNFDDGLYHGISYAKCRIWCETEKDIYLNLNAEKGIKIWINSNLIFKSYDIVINKTLSSVKLKKGWNRILTKVSMIGEKPYSGRECGFNMKFINNNGSVDKTLLFEPQ